MSFLWGNTDQQPADPKKFANISNDQINSNQQAQPVKYLAGRNFVAGDYISPAYNPKAVPIKAQSGKSESATTGYKYFADFALIFCMGGRHPVDAIYKVIVDSDIRWRGNITRGAGSRENITVPDLGTIHLYWGTETQHIDNVLLSPRTVSLGGADPQDSTTWPANEGENSFDGLAAGDENPYSGHYDLHPAYRGQCYAVFKNWKLGRDRTAVPNIQFELKRGCPWIEGNHVGADSNGISPICVLYDWLTDTRFGMGLPESSLNTASFHTAALAINAVGGRISPLISGQSDFRQVIAELLEYFDGWIRRNGTKIEVGVWQHGTILSSATLTDNELLGEPELEPQGWGPTVNEVTVVYKDRTHHYNDYTQVYRDPNNFRITGGPRPETLQRPWITDAELAKRYAREAGAAMALPVTGGNLTVKREWLTTNAMLPGKVFTYQSGFYELSFLMRLLEVEHAADDSASATLTVEWERSKWPSLYVPPAFQGPGGFVLGPRAIWQSRITEIPYLKLDDKFDTQVIVHAIRGNVEVQGYRVHVSLDGGATYQVVPNAASTSSFSYFGRLAAAIGTDVQGFWFTLYGVGLDEVVSQTGAQAHDDTLLAFIDGEVLSVGLVNVYPQGLRSCTAFRGRFGSPKAFHALNSSIFFIYRSDLKLIDNAGFIPGTVVRFKLQPFTADLDYDLTAITPIVYTVTGFESVPTPMVSPAPAPFVTSVTVTVSTPPAGFKVRVTRDNSPVYATSPEWPKIGAAYTTITLTSTTTLRVKFFSDTGRTSGDFIGGWTKVQQIPGLPAPTQQCGVPTWSFSGTLHQTSGTITLTRITAGSTINWIQTAAGGATTTGTGVGPITRTLACHSTGDTIEFWATLTGLDPSPHRTISNQRRITYGGGGQGEP